MAFSKVEKRRTCLHAGVPGNPCAGDAIRAHSVPAHALRLISREGKVYGFPLHFGAVVSARGLPGPRLIGVNDASTFTGFCAAHDDAIFAEIEKHPMRACEKHACLIAYRVACRELFAKEGATALGTHMATLDRGMSRFQQAELQAFARAFRSGAESGLRDIRIRKAAYQEALNADRYSAIRYYAVWFDSPPDIMCAGGTYPLFDFDGRQLQNLLNLDETAQSVTFTLTASQGRGCAFFAWHRIDDRVCVALLSSLACQADCSLPHALVRFAFGSFENVFWRPEWWEALPEAARARLLRRFEVAVDPEIPVPSNCLVDDGLRAVTWNVIERETNVPELSTALRSNAAD